MFTPVHIPPFYGNIYKYVPSDFKHMHSISHRQTVGEKKNGLRSDPHIPSAITFKV
jgi:hypothetical protein